MEYDKGIEREVIPFLPTTKKSKTSFLEVKYSILNSTLPMFKGGCAEEFFRDSYTNSTVPKINSDTQHIRNSKVAWSNCSKAPPRINGVPSKVQSIQGPIWCNHSAQELRHSASFIFPSQQPSRINLQQVKKNDKLSVPRFLD